MFRRAVEESLWTWRSRGFALTEVMDDIEGTRWSDGVDREAREDLVRRAMLCWLRESYSDSYWANPKSFVFWYSGKGR